MQEEAVCEAGLQKHGRGGLRQGRRHLSLAPAGAAAQALGLGRRWAWVENISSRACSTAICSIVYSMLRSTEQQPQTARTGVQVRLAECAAHSLALAVAAGAGRQVAHRDHGGALGHTTLQGGDVVAAGGWAMCSCLENSSSPAHERQRRRRR